MMKGEPTAPNTRIQKSQPIFHGKRNRMDLRVGMITAEVSSTCFIWGLGPLDLLPTRLSNPTEHVWGIMVDCSVIEAKGRVNRRSSIVHLSNMLTITCSSVFTSLGAHTGLSKQEEQLHHCTLMCTKSSILIEKVPRLNFRLALVLLEMVAMSRIQQKDLLDTFFANPSNQQNQPWWIIVWISPKKTYLTSYPPLPT